MQFVPEEYRPRVYWALAGDLAAPVVAWFVLKAIDRRRLRREAAQWPPTKVG